jgi:signal-transduction protein with cAMP-binding, CBS, and nucleotidyltransferase domain
MRTDRVTEEVDMPLREMATCPAVTCRATASAIEAARAMLENDIGFIVVVDDANHPVGVVTDRDLALRVLAGGKRGEVSVGSVMTRPPTCLSVHASALDAAKRMEKHLCRRLSLVDESGAVVGVLSMDDLLGEAVEEVKHLTAVMRDARRRRVLDLP